MRHRVRALATTASALTLLLAVAAPSHATTPATDRDNSLTTPAAVAYDGQTIFVGLMLGHGPVAEQYPDLVAGRVSGTDSQQLAEFSGLVTSAVQNIDATFFDTFGQAVTSGDRVQVDRALQSAGEVLNTALTEEMGGTAGANRPDLSVTVIVAVAVAVAVVAVAVAVALLLVEDIDGNSMAQIDHERWVDQVAEALAS